GGIAVEAVGLPGHPPGHLGVVHHDSRTAIIMDAVLERGLYTTDDELISPPPYASVAAYRGTIDRLRGHELPTPRPPPPGAPSAETTARRRDLPPAGRGRSHYAPIEGEPAVT